MEKRKKNRRTLQTLRRYRAKGGKKTKKTVNKRKKLSKKYCRKIGGAQPMAINVKTTDGDDLQVSVKPQDNIYESVLKGLGEIRFRHIKNNIYFGEDIISSGPDATFEEYGIEDGATLNVNIRKKGFDEILDDIIELNPHLRHRREELMTYTEYDADSWEELGERKITIDPEEPWCIKGHLDWNAIGITRIPESFGDLKIDGDVLLDRNHLISLPVSFGDLEVSGDLHLNNNRFHFLPQNFYRISVGGILMLTGNDLDIPNEPSTKDTDISKMKRPRRFPNVKGEVRVTA